MQKLLILCLLLQLSTFVAVGSERTWTGRISDSLCRTGHNSAVEHAGAKLTDHACTIACVKKGGKYVLVIHGKVYNIANQDVAGLEEQAGRIVRLRGEMNGHNIKVSSVPRISTLSADER